MPDLNTVLAVRPADVQALTMRGSAWSAMKEYPKALEDLNQAIEKQETVEEYVARAGVYEAQNKIGKASADFKRATELTPKNVFDVLAQTNAKQKVQQLSKRLPCGSKSDATCL